MVQLRGYAPLLVGGYGLVVNLDGTGSAEVPAYLRRWLINEMRKRGVGSAALKTARMSPEKVLASKNTAVVAVQGLIPPGATKGTRFDVLVSSLPQTQTTSLAGGRLWTVDLSVGGTDPSMRFSRKLAGASGPIYTNPFSDQTAQGEKLQFHRQSTVLSGGVVTTNRVLQLALNQSSWRRSRLISDRINERFPKAPYDRLGTAVPANDSYITLNIPARFKDRPQEMLELIRYLFTQRAPGFESHKAKELADILTAQLQYRREIALAWVAMGKIVLPVIRPYYTHPNQEVRLTALEAGARLEDEAVSDHMQRLTQTPDPTLRVKIAKILAYLPNSIRGARVLHKLLDDAEKSVKVAAYESLAQINDPAIRRHAIDGPEPDRFKFVLDLVPSHQPLIYIAQERTPRLVIFNPLLGFRAPFLAKLWDNRLMLRESNPGEMTEVFFQQPGQVQGRTYKIPPTVVDLIYLMAHKPTTRVPQEGLDLSYGRVVDAVYRLCQQGHIPSPTHLQISPLAQAIARVQEVMDPTRPETSKEAPFEPLPPPASNEPDSPAVSPAN